MKTEAKIKKMVDAFNSEKVLNLNAIKEIIGTTSRMTAFRKLKNLGYYSSYSHCGKYYTICSIPQFDRNNLWNYGGGHFSRYGNLMQTIPALVQSSMSGCFASELEETLHIFVQNALGKLYVSGQLMREKIGSQYLYLSPTLSECQIVVRKKILALGGDKQPQLPSKRKPVEQVSKHLKTFLSVLDERQRRLFLGFESLGLGHGGDVQMARASGVNVKTIARGRKELISKKIDLTRVRRKGAGRPPLKKTKS